MKRKTPSRRKYLTCQRKACGYSWSYGGHRKFYASCPACKTSVRINKIKNSIRGVQDTKNGKK